MMNKKSLFLFLAAAILPVALFSQEVLLDLEVNPVLFSKHTASEKSIMNNQEYYPIDTMKLPFIDDFSTNKLKRYYNWEYSDSINMVVCSEPAFSKEPTFHYYYTLDTIPLITYASDTSNATLDSVIPFSFHEFTFCNPFVPNDNDTASFWNATNDFTIFDTLGTSLKDTSLASNSFSRTIRKFHQFSAIRWTLNGDTIPSVDVSEDTTWHYYYIIDTAFSDTLSVNIARSELDTAIMLTPYEVVFHNGYNPFIPNDTVFYWPTEELYTFSDTDGVVLNNTNVTVDFLTLTNALDTVWIYEPDTGSLWIDNYAFINSTYPINPPSIGVATLDGVDETGMPYNFVTGLPYGVADYLTSKPIDLAAYEPSNNLFLSFYYQAQGRGNAPEQTDSLILQFRTPTNEWRNIWYAEGDELSTDSMFKQVMVPIDSSIWFEKGFQFRFLNYATLSGNVDHWHIDYVKLDKNRFLEDTTYLDVAYVTPFYSLLNNYQAMPWSHFLVDPAFFMNDTLLLSFHNLSDTLQKTDYRWVIYDEANTSIFEKYGGEKNFASHVFCQNIGQQCDPTDPLVMEPDFNFTFPDNGNNSAEFKIIASINPPVVDITEENDTLHYTQVFHNYYAYDDGTAENGYGLEIQSPTGASMAAYRFNMIKQDTLRGVRFYFNPQLEDVSQKLFSLMVWTGGETPETLVYQNDSLSPAYSPGLNYFRTYAINDTVLLLPAGNFFVGWMQLTNYRMNVGFDRNLTANENMFYNILGGGWLQSQLPGAWMIRPVFSSDTLPGDVFSIKENEVMSEFNVFPNPASDEVYIVAMNETGNSNDYMLNIFNSTGSVVKQVSYLPRSVSISELAPGFYFISIQNKETQEQKTYKLVISR